MKSIFTKKGLKKLKNLKNSILIYVLFITFLHACFQSNFNESNYVARFGENYLSKEKFYQLIGNYQRSDSLTKANEVINEWALRKILLSKASLNLDQKKLDSLSQLADEFKNTLYVDYYVEALLNVKTNLEIDSLEIDSIYNLRKNQMQLNASIYKYLIIEISKDFSDLNKVKQSVLRFSTEDQKYIDSISNRFKTYKIKNKNWSNDRQLIKDLNFISRNRLIDLKKSKFYQFEDSLSLYLIKIIDSKTQGDISPKSYVVSTLKQMILNERKAIIMSQLKNGILNEAIMNNKFEIY
jgi:hypothetical protein